MTSSRPRLFIGSSAEGLPIAKAVQANLDHACEVTIWSQGTFGLEQGTTLEALVNKLHEVDFAVLVLTPDDLIESRGVRQPSPRDNVLVELGMFIGRIGRDRTYIIYNRRDNLRLPSDLAGVTPATFEPHTDGNLRAALGAACTDIEDAIRRVGRRRESTAASTEVALEAPSDPPLTSAEVELLLEIGNPRSGGFLSKYLPPGRVARARFAAARQLVQRGLLIEQESSFWPTGIGTEKATDLWRHKILAVVADRASSNRHVDSFDLTAALELDEGMLSVHLEALEQLGFVQLQRHFNFIRVSMTERGTKYLRSARGE